MQAIRQIVDAEQLYPIIDIPNAMRNSKVEIIIMPVAPQETLPPEADYAALDKLYGSLHEYANHTLISGEKTAWQTAAIEKQLSSQNQ
ncbi:MAG: hypothetical protein LBD20_10285 [Spirochaetaceae bacterium]|jgi:hypothetical protein|nr:hypothetical protein [Spirochaetaceae bacterium]